MRNPAKDIRIAVANELVGLEYDGRPVPVFDAFTADDATFPRIVLSGVTGGAGDSRFSKCGFGGNWAQTIQVTTFFKRDVTSNPAEDIAGLVLESLVPMLPPFMDLGDNFTILNINGNIGSTTAYTDASGRYIDCNIIINYTVTEK